MNKKHILVFGDSNTWGYRPDNKKPFAPFDQWPKEQRWPYVMASQLGSDYEITVNGLCGRTASARDDIEDGTCGKEQVVSVLRAASPVDILVIMLGSNDLKARYGYTAYDVAHSVGTVAEKALTAKDGFRSCEPRILLISPPPLADLNHSFFGFEFKGKEECSRQLAPFYEIMAAQYGAVFFDAATAARFSDTDGLHLDAENHRALGLAVAEVIKKMK